MKLGDYHLPILNENLEVNTRPAKKQFYLTDMIYAEERLQYEDALRPYSESLDFLNALHSSVVDSESLATSTGKGTQQDNYSRKDSMSNALS